jgi:hypothetical protein
MARKDRIELAGIVPCNQPRGSCGPSISGEKSEQMEMWYVRKLLEGLEDFLNSGIDSFLRRREVR